jgi:hypothetical protein
MGPVSDTLSRLLADLYAAEVTAVRDGPDDVHDRRTRTDWTVRELLFHQLLDAQRTLVALASPAGPDGRPDVDAVSYWRPFQPDSSWSGSHAEFVRVAASAYPSGDDLLEHFRATTEASARAVAAADPAQAVHTQGHVITVADLTSTLVVEATVHLLDLVVDLPAAPTPPPEALAETRRVLEGLEGGPLPADWDDTEAVLKGTGRVPGWRALLG